MKMKGAAPMGTTNDIFERIVTCSPAFDKRSKDPKKNYGIGGMQIKFLLKGPLGIIQFLISTGWFLPETQRQNREWQYDHDVKFDKINPEGWDIGYHSPKPMYNDHTSMDCDLMPSGKCYYDGSSLRATEMITDFLAGGTEWLWKELEEEYNL